MIIARDKNMIEINGRKELRAIDKEREKEREKAEIAHTIEEARPRQERADERKEEENIIDHCPR